jgi:hypothetical protein
MYVNLTTSDTTCTVTAGTAGAQASVAGGSLGVLTVQSQTPFDSLNFSF